MVKIFGEIISYDEKNNNITLNLSFLTPEIIEEIKDSIEKKNKGWIGWINKYRETKQHFQQRCWYGSLALILKAQGEVVTKESLHIEDIEQRDSIFPVVSYIRNSKERYRPKRMSECTFDEMQRNIDILHKRHQHLIINGRPIDFSNLRLK